jgi:protein-L-isoaspartate(D-aspartate) O-methyltransferase
MQDGGEMIKSCLCIVVMSLVLMGCSSGVTTASSTTTIEELPTTAGLPEQSATSTQESKDELEFAVAREKLVRTGIIAYGISDAVVIDVMGRVPRHEFVPEEHLNLAYVNHAIPIGFGQTISQPFIVALMTQELEISEGDRVLEIGTGSGYQAAILAEIGAEVYTIEIISPLAEAVNDRFARLGYSEINTLHADGYHGWKEYGPFKRIIVTAAPDHVPPPLLEQLEIGGILIIPVGPIGGFQELWKIKRTGEETFESRSLGGVQFVPFTRSDDEPSE